VVFAEGIGTTFTIVYKFRIEVLHQAQKLEGNQAMAFVACAPPPRIKQAELIWALD